MHAKDNAHEAPEKRSTIVKLLLWPWTLLKAMLLATDNIFVDLCLLLLLSFEAVVCAAVILRVPYTEIDWVAYMQEVSGYEAGQTDYSQLRGDTGPLVYPAAFVYVFQLLKALTRQGHAILRAQCIFAGLYLLTQVAVFRLYRRAGRVPLYVFGLLCLSKRLHSIFVLRLFNDGVAMLMLYMSVLLFTRQRWRLGCVMYSLAVGVKMNVLLFAPGLLLLLLQAYGSAAGAVGCISICALVQLVIGLPFLRTYPVQYIAGAFNLGRVFMYKWTVNLKFLSEDVFVSKPLSVALLAMHVIALAFFARKWLAGSGGPAICIKYDDRSFSSNLFGRAKSALSPDYVVTTMLVSNFIGIVFARSLHYQFYAWYFHAIPFLCQRAKFSLPAQVAIFLSMEYAFGYVFPATAASSLLLQGAHIVLLSAVYTNLEVPQALEAAESSAKAKKTA